MQVLKALTDRRIFRYIFAYGAGGWAILEGVDTLADNGILPSWSYVAMFSLFVCGAPGAFIVAWFHGARGRQQVPRIERWLLAGVALFALVTTGFFVRGEVSSPPQQLLASAAAPVAPHEDARRIAVLYFDPRGGDDAEILAAGLTESLIDELSAVKPLTVITRNGSLLFRDAPASPDSIGRTLRAGTLVEGSVSEAGDRVRVDVRIVRSATGEVFGSTRIERPRSDVLNLQDELADSVAAFLRRRIGEELGERTLREGTRSVEAWERVQQAEREIRTAAAIVSANDLNDADEPLQRADSLLALAEAADPSWVEPVVRRGWVAYRRSRLVGMQRSAVERWIAEAHDHATRALTLDPSNASALELRGTLTYWRVLLNLVDPDIASDVGHAAEADLRAAIAAGGNAASAYSTLSHLLMNKGDVAQAKLAAVEAYTRDAFLENANLTIWRVFQASWVLQDEVEARRYCDEGAGRFPDDYRFKQCALMLYALPDAQVDVRRAWSLLADFTRLSPPQVRAVNEQRGRAYVAIALAQAQLADSARAVLRDLHADATIDPLRETALVASVAYARLGDVDDAVRQLELYFTANPSALEEYRHHVEARSLPWYHQPLIDKPAFLTLVGAH